MHLIKVDFPAPLSPRTANTSPAKTSMSTSSRARTPPKRLVPLLTERNGIEESGLMFGSPVPDEACFPGARATRRTRPPR